MADPNPTGGGDPVAITIPSEDQTFLRFIFEVAQGGVRENLADPGVQLNDRSRSHREIAVYAKLLEALDSGSIVPDRDVIDVLRDLAEVNDKENEALHGLLHQIDRLLHRPAPPSREHGSTSSWCGEPSQPSAS